MKTVFFFFAFAAALCHGTPTLRGGEEEEEGVFDVQFQPRDLTWKDHDHDHYDCDGDWGWIYTHHKDKDDYVYWKVVDYKYVQGYNDDHDGDAYYWKHCSDGKLINKAYPGYALSYSGKKHWLKLTYYDYADKWYYDEHDYQFKLYYHTNYCADLYRDYDDYYHLYYCKHNWYDQIHYWEY